MDLTAFDVFTISRQGRECTYHGNKKYLQEAAHDRVTDLD